LQRCLVGIATANLKVSFREQQHMLPWTQLDRTRLLELSKREPVAQISKLLGRSKSSINNALGRAGAKRPKNNGWRPDEIERLAQLWPLHPASVIATRLGRSRNAVLGEVFRQRRAGLKLQSEPTRPKPKHARSPRKRKPQLKLVMSEPKPPPRYIQCPCQLVELETGQCKWPFGNPHEDGFYFCGAVARDGDPYCLVHMRIAHQRDPRQERSRQRSAPVAVA
jgi:GcrA cell cycle regulator